jgi:dimethylargininase
MSALPVATASTVSPTYSPPYIVHDAGVLSAALALRPSASVERLVPVKGEPSPIAERAFEQHAILVGTLRSLGVNVTVLEPALGAPTESLLADCAVILRNGAILTRPSSVHRRHETATVEEALAALGIPILGRIEAPGLLDATDVAVGTDRVIVGVPRAGGGLRSRSNELGRSQLEAFAAAAGLRTVELALAPDVLRLRNVFNFIAHDTIVAAPDRVDLVPVADLTAIDLPRGEDYEAGILPLGPRRVLANLRYRESIAMLRKAKITVEAIDLWEFGKAGAGPFSLVLALKRS